MRKLIRNASRGTLLAVGALVALAGLAVAALILQANVNTSASTANKQMAFITGTLGNSPGVAGSVNLIADQTGEGTCTATLDDGLGGEVTVSWSGIWSGSDCLVHDSADTGTHKLFIKNLGSTPVALTGMTFSDPDFGFPGDGQAIEVELQADDTGTPIALDGSVVIPAGDGLAVQIQYTVDSSVADPGVNYGPVVIGIQGN